VGWYFGSVTDETFMRGWDFALVGWQENSPSSKLTRPSNEKRAIIPSFLLSFNSF